MVFAGTILAMIRFKIMGWRSRALSWLLLFSSHPVIAAYQITICRLGCRISLVETKELRLSQNAVDCIGFGACVPLHD